MDLREKVSVLQRISEYSIRFRLIEIIIAIALCIVALINIEGVLASMLILSRQVSNVAVDLMLFNFHTNNIIVYAILALFLFRCVFFGFKCALLWFFFLLFNGLFLISAGEYKDVMQILLAVIFIIAVTLFFFVRSLIIKSILPLLLLLYSFSAWLLFLGVSNPAWFGLASIFCADTAHLIFGLKAQISNNDDKHKKTLEGAIAHGAKRTIPVSLLTIILLIIMDTIFYTMEMPIFAASELQNAIAIYISYALWFPFFTAALLSFCPLENTCEKIQKNSK
ncbi:MAG: hypothetical protein FWC15_01835 [Fibromonadales bacterium]|nr:hypothetical protein [Fibromonadales bacterium]